MQPLKEFSTVVSSTSEMSDGTDAGSNVWSVVVDLDGMGECEWPKIVMSFF